MAIRALLIAGSDDRFGWFCDSPLPGEDVYKRTTTSWAELHNEDIRAIFTAAAKAQQAAEYLRSFSENTVQNWPCLDGAFLCYGNDPSQREGQMLSVIVRLVRQVLPGAFAGVIASLIMLWLTKPGPPNVSVQYDWVPVPNIARMLSYDDRQKLHAFLKAFPAPVAIAAFDKTESTSADVALFWIKITNSSSRRTGTIEVSLPNIVVWCADLDKPACTPQHKLDMGALVPGDSRVIAALSAEHLYFHSPFDDTGLAVLDGDQRIPVTSVRIEDYEDVFGIEKLLRSYPMPTTIVIIICVVAVITVIVLALLRELIAYVGKHRSEPPSG